MNYIINNFLAASGGSGSGRGGRQIGGSSAASSQQLIRGLDQFGNVPSPAPNSNCGGNVQLTKLLTNGTSIVHSTPKGI